ncbi:hypothetical protein Bca101_085125 [Brassica carinata]
MTGLIGLDIATDSYYNPNFTSLYALFSATLSRISLAGLAVMGQNLALNIAEKGFQISVYNRTTSIVDETLERAAVEGNLPVSGQYSPRDFVLSLRRQCRRSRTCLQLNVMILEDEELPSLYKAVTSTYYSWWDACHHPHWCFYEGSWCGFFWSGQNNIPIAAASPKSWQRFKNKIEMISRRVLKESDFSCSDGISQSKETTVTKARH